MDGTKCTKSKEAEEDETMKGQSTVGLQRFATTKRGAGPMHGGDGFCCLMRNLPHTCPCPCRAVHCHQVQCYRAEATH